MIERTIKIAVPSPQKLQPEHCDALYEGALQNGDVPMLETIERARRNWDDAKAEIFRALAMGYPVRKNDAPRID